MPVLSPRGLVSYMSPLDSAATSTDAATSLVPWTLPSRPRLRGRIHSYALIGAVIPGATLVAVAGATVSGIAAGATAVYVVCVLGLFGASAAYHRGRWTSARSQELARRADHAMIFLLIAGTYTPLTLLAMPSVLGLVLLGVAWVGAIGGVTLTVLHPRGTQRFVIPFYLALGWVAVFALPDLLVRTGVTALALIVAGGLIYTAGAIGFAVGRPRGRPETFGYHEFFHVATVVAATCHYVATWFMLYS